MVLWANGCRSYLEGCFGADPAESSHSITRLEAWVERELAAELTSAEAKRHRLGPGTWTKKQTVEDSWDCEAAASLSWAVGLRRRYPSWDKQSTNLGYDCMDAPAAKDWHSEIALRRKSQIDHQAMSVEARYWRIRSREPGEPADAYRKKLMWRAAELGQVKLAPDGDLALTDGTSVAKLSEFELGALGSILSERLTGLNWLCGRDEDWDMVTADTAVTWLWDQAWPESPGRG